jgi:hypothetical protein
MDTITQLEILYIVSAVICAVLYPFDNAKSAQYKGRYNRGQISLRFYLTWGHIVRGFLLGLLPVINTIYVAISIFTGVADFVSDMDNKNVFTPKGSDR